MARTKMNVLTKTPAAAALDLGELTLRRSDRAMARTKWQNKATLRQVESELRARTRERDRRRTLVGAEFPDLQEQNLCADQRHCALHVHRADLASALVWSNRWRRFDGGRTPGADLIPIESGMVVEVRIPEAA
jgi:hypothetical protein